MSTTHSTKFNRALTLALLCAPALAQAHPGGHHLTGFNAGAAHPLLGLDHLLAMIAVGLWATQLKGKAVWAVPAAFVSVMTVGAALAIRGISVPGVEQGVVTSVLALGVLIAASVRLPLAASVALVSLFAFCHGQAHGAEMPASAAALTYGVGFVVTTSLLHLAGITTGLVLRGALALRLAGAAVALVAALMILGIW